MSTDRGREKEGLNLETETFTSCAVLNAKHVTAYCRGWLSQPFGPFLFLLLLREGSIGEAERSMSELALGCLPA